MCVDVLLTVFSFSFLLVIAKVLELAMVIYCYLGCGVGLYW